MVELVEDDRAKEDDVGGRARWLIALLGLMLRRPQDTLAAGVASAALIAILVNALFLQPNPHPAPLFSVKPKARPAAIHDSTGGVVVLPRPRPADLGSPRAEPAAKPLPAMRPRSDIIIDIQRELSRRGIYDGAVDGIHGSRTEAAIRSFERAAGTTVGAEPGEAMLQAIMRAPAAVRPGTPRRADPIGDLVVRTTLQGEHLGPAPLAATAAAAPIASSARYEQDKVPPGPAPNEPPSRPQPGVAARRPEPVSAPARSEIAVLPSRQEPGMPAAPSLAAGAEKLASADHPVPRADLPTPQVKAVQRALSEFGYGQLKPTGIVDSATATAIRDFEEARDLPITGRMSDRMVQELAAMTGHAIE